MRIKGYSLAKCFFNADVLPKCLVRQFDWYVALDKFVSECKKPLQKSLPAREPSRPWGGDSSKARI
jgi:hypothetical protein